MHDGMGHVREKGRFYLCSIASSVYQFNPSSAFYQPSYTQSLGKDQGLTRLLERIVLVTKNGKLKISDQKSKITITVFHSHLLGPLRSDIQRQWGSCTTSQ
jgi:hypothetical protein